MIHFRTLEDTLTDIKREPHKANCLFMIAQNSNEKRTEQTVDAGLRKTLRAKVAKTNKRLRYHQNLQW